MLFTWSGQSPFFDLHDFYRIWATKFTYYLQSIEQHHISHLHVVYMLFKKFTGYLQRRYCKFVPEKFTCYLHGSLSYGG